MKYYRVKPQFDNKQLFERKNGYLYPVRFLVGNELFTENEYKKICNVTVQDITSCFDIVNINKNNTFWFFGARFSD